MKLYELTYFLSPRLAEKEAQDSSEKIINFIQDKRGIITEIRDQKRIFFSYPIKKEREGYLVSLNFYFDPKELPSLKDEITADNQILRSLISAKKVIKRPTTPRGLPKIKKIETFVSAPIDTAKEISPKSSGRERIKKEKVELAEIEQKLEEILGE